MADHFSTLDDSRSDASLTGVSTSLGEEARDVRNAGRKLAEGDDTDVVAAVAELRALIVEQKRSNALIARQMQSMVKTMREVLDEAQKIKTDATNTSHAAQQAALDGVNAAQQKAEEMTLKNIDEVTVRCGEYINKMVQESKRRIERLAMITLPDRLFYFGKWVVLMLLLIVLCHVVWQMLFV